MNLYFFIIILTGLLLAFGFLIYSYRALEVIKIPQPPKEHMFIWAFGKWPEDLENIPELIRLWNAKHGEELNVKDGEDLHQVFSKITQLWEKQHGSEDGKSNTPDENSRKGH
jgi:hypothetical protein